MKTEIQIKRKFSVVKKEREEALEKKRQIQAGTRKVSGPAEVVIASYQELIQRQTGFLEALNWVR